MCGQGRGALPGSLRTPSPPSPHRRAHALSRALAGTIAPLHATAMNSHQLLGRRPPGLRRPAARPPPPRPGSRAAARTAADAAASRLLRAVDGDQRWGASSTPEQRAEVLQLVAELKQDEAAGGGKQQKQRPLFTLPWQQQQQQQQEQLPPTQGPLDGDWRLLWTTEASVHELVRGQLLGIGVRDIRQQVDLGDLRVTNTIHFALLGLKLEASGPLAVQSPTRIFYSFDRLALGLLGLSLPLPPVIRGGGWTECVVLREGAAEGPLRVMENSRRDTLVLQRVLVAGAPP